MCSSWFMMFSLCGLDSLYFTTASHVATHFKVLNIKMSNLGVEIKRTKRLQAFSDVHINSAVFELIQRHNHNFELFYLLEKIYNSFMVTVFFQDTVILCVIIFQFIDVSINCVIRSLAVGTEC